MIAVLLSPQLLRAGDIPAPFSYAWKIVFRGEEIGHALSRFSFRDVDGNLYLTEAGTRGFAAGFGPITITFSEETSVIWDESGLMMSYVSDSTIGKRRTERRAERGPEGAVVWRSVSAGDAEEKLFSPGEFDYTDGDRFIGRPGQGTDPRTFRVLSLSRGKILSITYRLVGREVVDVGGARIEASRVIMDGPGGEGTFLIDDLGIALGFTIDTFLGDFSFIPTGRR